MEESKEKEMQRKMVKNAVFYENENFEFGLQHIKNLEYIMCKFDKETKLYQVTVVFNNESKPTYVFDDYSEAKEFAGNLMIQHNDYLDKK